MKALDLLWGLLKLSLVAVGAFYTVQVLVTYAKSGSYRSAIEGPVIPVFDGPVIDGKDGTRSAWRLLIWGGVMLVSLVLRLARPLVNLLSEASAEVGEWVIPGREPAPRRGRENDNSLRGQKRT